MTSPYYNRLPFSPGTVVKAEAVNAELAKIAAAFDKLPAPTAIPAGGGSPNYTHYAYADSADGTSNFTTGAAGTRAYVGVAVNQPSATPSTNAEDYAWSRLRGTDGSNGAAGSDGSDGAAGDDGLDGNYVEFRFIRSAAPPAQATGSTPAGTTTTIPDGTATLWVTFATRNGAGVIVSTWSPWQRFSPFGAPEAYDNARTYYEGEQVLFGGGTYVLLVASSTGTAPSGTAQPTGVWGVIASPGDVGEPATAPSGFTATIDLTSSNIGLNLRSVADANGYTGKSDATITFRVPSGVVINGAPGAGSGGGPAIDTGFWPTDSYTITLNVVVQSGGIVNGGGGKGGDGGSGFAGTVGGAGGDAIFQRVNLNSVTVDSGGTLRGGGGGGAGGAGSVETFGDPRSGFFTILISAGGGGGGGAPNGTGGTGASTYSGTPAANGNNGTTTAGGTGGAGEPEGTATATAGGNGGGFGAAGSAVGALAGGVAGYAVRRNGFTSPYTNNGTVAGTVG